MASPNSPSSAGLSQATRPVVRRPPPRPRHRLVHDNHILLLALAAGAPGVGVSLGLLWTGDYSSRVQWTATVFIGGAWLMCAFSARAMVIRPLQTLANMHAALREGDFSMRARASGRQDALSELMFEINALTDAMREEKMGALEAGALLNRVMGEIEVAVFAFDAERQLRVANRAGE